MSFLAPLYLLGALAVALPVVFHLVRRSSKERMVFSSLMFLKSTPPRMTRRNRLEHILLLLLRSLAICALAFAFARPFFQKPIKAAPAGPGTQIAVLVDTSASMKREGLWAAALAKVEEIQKRATPADQVAIFTFDIQVRTVMSFEQWTALNAGERVALATQRLTENPPTWQATQAGHALTAAAAALEDAEQQTQPSHAKRIVLVTDLQEGSHLDGVQGHDWPRGLQVVVETVRARRPTNAGLQWVLDAEGQERSSGEADARLRVSNSADAQREQFQLRWEGVPGAPSLDAYVPPGQSRVVPAPKLPAGVNGGRIVLSGDDEAFDNTVHLLPPRVEEVQVVFVGDDPEKDPAQLLYYLKRAFQGTRRQAVRLIAVTSADPAPGLGVASTPAGGTNAGSVSLTHATNRLVILSGAVPGPRTPAVRQFLEAGGVALFVMKDANSASSLAQVAGLPQLSATESDPSRYALLGRMEFEHPLLAPFSDPRYSDFSKIRFWKRRQVAAESLPNARVIARFDNDDPAILELPVGRGRLFVFTSSWRPADSQFALSSKFVPMLGSLLEQATGQKAPPAQYRVGDPVDLAALGLSASGGSWVVRKPDGATIPVAHEARFTGTDQPGLYELQGGPGTVRFVVNLDPAESRTAPLPADELARLGVPMQAAETAAAVPPSVRQSHHEAELEARQKPWRWLLLAALVVLISETWLAGRITRRSAVTAEGTV